MDKCTSAMAIPKLAQAGARCRYSSCDRRICDVRLRLYVKDVIERIVEWKIGLIKIAQSRAVPSLSSFYLRR